MHAFYLYNVMSMSILGEIRVPDTHTQFHGDPNSQQQTQTHIQYRIHIIDLKSAYAYRYLLASYSCIFFFLLFIYSETISLCTVQSTAIIYLIINETKAYVLGV